MATPTLFSVPPVEATALCEALNAVTPPPRFASSDTTQSYDYICELEHCKFTPRDVEEIRGKISDPAYRQREAQCYKEKLAEIIWRKLTEEQPEGVEGWRKVVEAYRRRLRRHGCTIREVRDMRWCITDQEYWKPESQQLREASEQCEQAWLGQRAKHKAKVLHPQRYRNNRVGHRRSKRRSQHTTHVAKKR